MASINKDTHERESQKVDGSIYVESENAACEFYYSRDSKGVRLLSAMHGEIDLKKVFTFSDDIFANVEAEIEEMLESEEAPEEAAPLEDGYQTGGI